MSPDAPATPTFAPLRHTVFRRIWIASLLSNFGLLINGVGAGWAMTEMSGRPEKVALVQTALMLPFMLFSMAAGAISDTYDRRKVSMAMLGFAFASAVLLFAIDVSGLLTPNLLLLLCFLIGTANAMFGPAWQASVSAQVPPGELPAAVALNSISYNIARSFGPAVGGLLVALAGSMAAFATNALCCLPILLALYLWRPVADLPRLPPERIVWAVVSGVRYMLHSPPMRAVVVRCIAIGSSGGAISSLMPLIAHDMIGGAAATYGVLLGAFGLGAVAGALLIGPLRRRLSLEAQVGGCTVVVGVAVIALSFCRSEPFAIVALVVAGASWMQVVTSFNVVIQTRAPRWVAGRALAAYQASIAGGLAGGSWLWGTVAQHVGTAEAVALSGIALIACAALALWLRLPDDAMDSAARPMLAEPEVGLALTGRSGPIVVEVEYAVAPDNARRFYDAMLEVGRIRRRNGAYLWSLSRDVASDEVWVERYHCPTWHDYLRQRDRMTIGEQAHYDLAMAETRSAGAMRVRRLLERPLGSVRWQSASPDPGVEMPVGSP